MDSRGEPALISKEYRVKAALNNGVDLIVELPYLLAVNSADIFASKSVEILSLLKVKDMVLVLKQEIRLPLMKSILIMDFLILELMN